MTNAEWIRSLPEEQLADFLDAINSLGNNGYGVADYDTPASFESYETLQWVFAEHFEQEG